MIRLWYGIFSRSNSGYADLVASKRWQINTLLHCDILIILYCHIYVAAYAIPTKIEGPITITIKNNEGIIIHVRKRLCNFYSLRILHAPTEIYVWKVNYEVT